jgi:hypothetical protein
MKKWGVGILEYWVLKASFHSLLRLAHGLQGFELFELFERLELSQVVMERLAPRSLCRK